MKPATASGETLHWDIFCNVIDNYGDIGVTWRLARQLVQEQHQQVQLWVDDLAALAMMCPDANADLDDQWLAGVRVRRWGKDGCKDGCKNGRKDWRQQPVADVVVEAFGCTIPEAYIEAMISHTNAGSSTPTLWLNLEYLSAESWVEECHGLPSRLGNQLQKYFFFPGFTPKTGGLLREADLITGRDRFQSSKDEQTAYLASRGVQPKPDARLISLFSYESPQLGSWLDELSHSEQPICLLVPQGRIVADVQRWLAVEHLGTGDHHTRGNLELYILPFTTQDDYDRLLWCCDFNIVRGEDSFVRAQWAGRPFLWHIYPQDEEVHLIKLRSFLELYTAGLSGPARHALERLWLDWNNHEALVSSWKELNVNWPEVHKNAQKWCILQGQQKNISQAIVTFAQERLLCGPRI